MEGRPAMSGYRLSRRCRADWLTVSAGFRTPAAGLGPAPAWSCAPRCAWQARAALGPRRNEALRTAYSPDTRTIPGLALRARSAPTCCFRSALKRSTVSWRRHSAAPIPTCPSPINPSIGSPSQPDCQLCHASGRGPRETHGAEAQGRCPSRARGATNRAGVARNRPSSATAVSRSSFATLPKRSTPISSPCRVARRRHVPTARPSAWTMGRSTPPPGNTRCRKAGATSQS